MLFKKNIIKVPVEVSARHCHLAKAELEKLFGAGYELKKFRQLSQPSDFACEETVSVQVGFKTFEKVRIIGPLREQTQVELSFTDAIGSGETLPVRLSGDLKGSKEVFLKGPAGIAELSEGLIIARRHIHCSTEEAKKMGLKAGDKVAVRIAGDRQLVFEKVIVRVKDNYRFTMHIDADEGNAAEVYKTGEGIIV